MSELSCTRDDLIAVISGVQHILVLTEPCAHTNTHSPTASGFIWPVRLTDDLVRDVKSLATRTLKRWEALRGPSQCLLHEKE